MLNIVAKLDMVRPSFDGNSLKRPGFEPFQNMLDVVAR
jgi:hypothetical protein